MSNRLLLAALVLLAAISLAWGAWHAMADSADLLRRAREVALFVRGRDPYDSRDMTYPPTAPPVFTPLVAPFGGATLKAVWLVLNLAALAALCEAMVRLWGRRWPAWLQAAFCLAVAASRPVHGGIGLGQFHLLPMLLIVLSLRALEARRDVAAGLLLGVALVKPTMALPFLGLLAARRRWWALGAAFGLQAALLAGVSAWLRIGPMTLVREWISRARTQVAEGTIDLPTLAHRAWPEAPGLGVVLSLGVLILACAATFAWRRRSGLGLASLCAAAAALFTYHRYYDLVLLTPSLAYLMDVAHEARGRSAALKIAAAVAFAALLIVPEHLFARIGLRGAFEATFVALTYLFLGLSVAYLAGDRGR